MIDEPLTASIKAGSRNKSIHQEKMAVACIERAGPPRRPIIDPYRRLWVQCVFKFNGQMCAVAKVTELNKVQSVTDSSIKKLNCGA